MKRYKAIIFDFDMTLADSAKVIAELLNVCANDFGYPSQDFDMVYPIIGNTHEIMLSHVTGQSNPDELYRMREHYRQLCLDRMAAKTELFPDTPDCIRTISSMGLKIGLLSLKLRDVLMQSLVEYDIDKYFSVVVGCEDVATPKPDPSGLFVALEALGVGADEAIYIGDSLVDEGAARAAGMDFSVMLRGGTKREAFDEGFVKRFYNTATELCDDFIAMMTTGREHI